MELHLDLSEQKITNLDIDEFEKSIGYKLPESYKEFILKYNGGIPNKPYFNQYHFNCFNSIKYGESTIEAVYKIIKDILPNGYFPIAWDPGGALFCFDLNKGGTYGFLYFLPEGDDPELVTENFQDLLDELIETNLW